MFADIIIESCQDITSHIISTKSEGAVNNKNLPLNAIQPCTQEETDTHIFSHVNDIANHGHRRITIITVDTDVVVIALHIFFAIDVDELWIEFCTGKNKRWLPINLYANALGEECCRALLFWFCFTGCDTVSQFCGRGKKTVWDVWRSYPKVT